jgi:hypothetical protein
MSPRALRDKYDRLPILRRASGTSGRESGVDDCHFAVVATVNLLSLHIQPR